MHQLFSTEGEFKIVRLQDKDVRSVSDHLKDFSGLILQNEPMYPGIDNWLKGKVIPGLKDRQRVAYVGYVDGIPAASAVGSYLMMLAENSRRIGLPGAFLPICYVSDNRFGQGGR
ncbi:MAG: hypothetical protein FJY85_10145, partial [Deltaproteobacteria bacterium]|nr:hypothetical protein [Deltaproteobacteria bacterium]